ncbi:sodium:proton antiporter [Rhodoblastus sphagnicola]|uniref:Sodium:proton antiporter n=1 Tax=Rhodoblastus sphagnicola TaxID=333368 RepID=A0A2S6N0P6_9HYPH|nr:sodium:proton antiporter [Rhodoblastus sphagnicola]MBB4200484.1 CPA1 family monovalent cation:H+ antiporter [Rhodoblastus sphagnicola]PPQ28168.1 sodium:proton antiporter [Rhodoblastus sphagnicola]
MLIFETILALLLGAALLSMLARAIGAPYPVLLALGGAVLAFAPGLPSLDLPPDLILALFVAPVLLDAAHDMSFRDLKRNWRPVFSLVVVAVGLTTLAVAMVARWFLPDMPWGAAIALGALLAPPDAVSAIAVMRQAKPPHRIRSVLEGESLLNDATSLLIYRLAVGAVVTGELTFQEAAPQFLLVAFGSVIVGWSLARLALVLINRIADAPTSTVLQFITTFGVWLLAERLGLSEVVTLVTFGLTAGRGSTLAARADVRLKSYANWETVTFVLNVLAFTLIGLQLRPILAALEDGRHIDWLLLSLVILAVVIAVRLAWAFIYRGLRHATANEPGEMTRPESMKAALIVGWSGMRGIVTLAAALALPEAFPYRPFILLTAFTVVLGTLVIQGATLRPLLAWLDLPADRLIEQEIALARAATLTAALEALGGEDGPAAERLRLEYASMLEQAKAGQDPYAVPDKILRRQIIPHARHALDDLRCRGEIGDDAYRQVEHELDRLELTTRV